MPIHLLQSRKEDSHPLCRVITSRFMSKNRRGGNGRRAPRLRLLPDVAFAV